MSDTDDFDEAALREATDKARARWQALADATPSSLPPEALGQLVSPKAFTDKIAALCQEGARLAREYEAKHGPDLEAEIAKDSIPILEHMLPAFTRGVRFGGSAIEQRVSRHAAIEEARVAAVNKEPKVVFVGTSGKGKTSLVAAAVRKRLEGVWVQRSVFAFVGCREIALARQRYPLGDGEPPIVEEALDAMLLVLDDLGQDPYPAPTTSPIVDIVLERYERMRATWVTTFLTRAEMGRRYGDGFTRRILEDAIIIQCGNKPIDMETP